jgi:hypothetical protein
MAHINVFPFLGNAQVALDILSSCATHQSSYLIQIVLTFSSFLLLLASFDKRVLHVCGDIMNIGSWEYI